MKLTLHFLLKDIHEFANGCPQELLTVIWWYPERKCLGTAALDQTSAHHSTMLYVHLVLFPAVPVAAVPVGGWKGPARDRLYRGFNGGG